jgi:2-polyprenyl-3-methyl-5-hydroxy-6-metoxy-1,4-benzoquinol methylase
MNSRVISGDLPCCRPSVEDGGPVRVTLVERDCPVCGSSKRSRALSQEADFVLVRCLCCRMLYTHQVRSRSSQIGFYADLAAQRQDSTAAERPPHYSLANQIRSVRLYDAVLRYALSAFPSGDVHLVDIGCAGGLLLLSAQVAEDSYNCGHPPRIHVRGVSIDPNERRETERNVGCPVADPEAAADSWPQWAQIVTALNVIEHVDDPVGLLVNIRRLLQPGGMLIIDVPNNLIASAKARLSGKWSVLDLGEHINHFTPATLDRLVSVAGFSRVRRLPGLLRWVDAPGTAMTASRVARWMIARTAMTLSGGRIHAFPHLTAVYRSNK